MICSRKKRVGDRRHLCLTPTVVLNHSPVLPWTALVALSLSHLPIAVFDPVADCDLDWLFNSNASLLNQSKPQPATGSK